MDENIPRAINEEKPEYMNNKKSSTEDEPTIECVASSNLRQHLIYN